MASEKLNKYRRKGRQKMTVEHVHVHEGGQAIVGNVNNQGGRLMIKYTEQPRTLCGAKTRNEKPCQNPPELGKRRCWMHGGAEGSGAPLGNKNALKHGYYTAEAIAERKRARQLISESLDMLESLGNRTVTY